VVERRGKPFGAAPDRRAGPGLDCGVDSLWHGRLVPRASRAAAEAVVTSKEIERILQERCVINDR
jgi:hypothetical protein